MILQGCFKGTGAVCDCCSASEVSIQDMGQNTPKHTKIKQITDRVDNAQDVLRNHYAQ